MTVKTAQPNRPVDRLHALLHEYGIPHTREAPLAAHGTWRIGGPADLLAEPRSPAEVSLLVRSAARCRLPWVAVGRGSNLLFDDRGLRGLVIKLGRALSQVTRDGSRVQAAAGVALPRLARWCARRGLSGLEHTVGIPGSLGGLIVMNGGSLRRTIGQVVIAVTHVDPAGTLHTRAREACDFGYRRSRFQTERGIVVGATLELRPADPRLLQVDLREILRTRRAKFPLTYPNCGSVFKNNPALWDRVGPPGRAVEALGLKGLRIGDASVSHRHANFILNHGRATSRDILRLIQTVRCHAARTWGLILETEVRYVDPAGRMGPAHRMLPVPTQGISPNSRKGSPHTAQA